MKKIFKMPAVIFSAGIIAAFALFAFFQPQKPAVEIVEANSTQPQKTAIEIAKTNPTKPAQEDSQKEIGIVPEQESVFLASGSYFNSNAEWSTWFIPPSQKSYQGERQERFTTDLNGDGLLDLIVMGRYSTQESDNQSRVHSDRVYLNNGSSWNLVYSCDASYQSHSSNAYYFGDCATTDPSLNQKTNHGCFSDYTSWPHSGTHKDGGAWNLSNIQFYFEDTRMGSLTANEDFELLTDINGDGLPDYVWADSKYGPYGLRRCVYLNNGHGWDLAYRCVEQSGILYGDCAQPPYYGS